MTIRACGDFTATVGRFQSGDLFAVHGPFGRFSHLLQPERDELVFIAGGVGITPLMSMLRYMHIDHQPRRVLLIYASRDASAILFRRELEAIQAAGTPQLKTVHIVSRPPPDWPGDAGRLDAERLRTICGEFAGKAFFICCPSEMANTLIAGLQAPESAGKKFMRIALDFMRWAIGAGQATMQRFRLAAIYFVGVLIVIALAIWGVALRGY